MMHLDLFAPATAAAIADFLGLVGDVEHGMRLVAAGRVQPDVHRTWEQRARATFAANRIDVLKAVLLEEGGHLVVGRDLERELTHYPELPKLDPASFHQPRR